jgi:hypothetical protein
LADAIEALSAGALRCVPICGPVDGPWSHEAVLSLVESAPAIQARLIANLRTGALWGSRPAPELLLAWLDGRELPGAPPPADWDVGHFVELAGLVRGRDEDRGRALVVVHDSYPTLGWLGHHLQPPEAVAAALRRGDGSAGGVLCVVPGSSLDATTRTAGSLGLKVQLWDNGTSV